MTRRSARVVVRRQADLRYPDRAPTIDEVVALNARVHLERLSDQGWSLIVETDAESVWFWIGAQRAHVEVVETERTRTRRGRGRG